MVHALVVDDSRAMRMLLRRSLERLGFVVCEASNGHEALAVLEEMSAVPEIALVDWNMPEMKGLEFVKEIHSDRRWSTMTVMMVTSEGEPARLVEALTAGAHEYLTKPFEQAAFVNKLNLHGLAANEVNA
jgi:two-component system, chemotaxis family, chemotaxis protein CheY